ncbi:MAG: peroxiredoxin [Rickettsiaceae bacterium]|nr:peroxiredoxin [Rickettsiaceae bacterium]
MTNIYENNKAFVGQNAIDFTLKAVMADNSIAEFNLKNYIAGHKAVLFFYPLDFTFVCPSELIAINNRLAEFNKRKTKVMAISVDSHFSHLAWKKTSHNDGGVGNLQFPMLSDFNKKVSSDYGVLIENDGVALRGSFIIDTDFTVRHITINDLPLGRNIDEMIRLLDAIDYHNTNGEVCPAGWNQGKGGMTATSEGVADYLASHSSEL